VSSYPLPQAPRSYREEEVHFQSGEATLAGVLCLPPGSGPYPAVIYIPGSGWATRDGLGMLPQHWEAFARRGIASLSWDKPGVGDSSGDWTAQTMQDRAQEAVAAIRFLKGRPEIVPTKIGAWGISQAGWVLPLVCSLSSADVAFLIVVSVPVGTGDEQELFRIAHQLPADGYPALTVDKVLAFSQLRIYLKNQHAPFDCIAQLQRLVEEEVWFAEVGAWDADAYDFLRRLEVDISIPQLLETITCPVLAIFGERDTIVDGKQSAQVYATALKKAGNADVTITTFPGADHALFLSETGGMKELQQSFLKPAGQKVFAPGYLDFIAEWVQQRFGKRNEVTQEPGSH
jgi:uncharacterized protein